MAAIGLACGSPSAGQPKTEDGAPAGVQPVTHPLQYLIVVRRHELARYAALRSSFSDEPVQIIWDRRRTDRRGATPPSANPQDRRQGDRRGPPPDTWRYLDFVMSPGVPGKPSTVPD